jgi:hypothetical protein
LQQYSRGIHKVGATVSVGVAAHPAPTNIDPLLAAPPVRTQRSRSGVDLGRKGEGRAKSPPFSLAKRQ